MPPCRDAFRKLKHATNYADSVICVGTPDQLWPRDPDRLRLDAWTVHLVNYANVLGVCVQEVKTPDQLCFLAICVSTPDRSADDDPKLQRWAVFYPPRTSPTMPRPLAKPIIEAVRTGFTEKHSINYATPVI